MVPIATMRVVDVWFKGSHAYQGLLTLREMTLSRMTPAVGSLGWQRGLI